MESLDVVFRLLDRVSPTLDVMDHHLRSTKNSLAEVDKALKNLDRAEKQARFSLERDPMKRYRLGLELMRENLAGTQGATAAASGALGALGVQFGLVAGVAMQATSAIAAVGAAVGRSALDVGLFAIRSASFKRDTLTAYGVIEGSASFAQETFERLTELADKTPFKTSDVLTFGKVLRSAGFDIRQTEDLLAGMFDVASLQGDRGSEMAHRLLEGIVKVRGMDVLNLDTLREQIVGAGAAAGLELPTVFAAIARGRNTTIAQARALVSAGQIKGEEGVRAILDAIRVGVDKGGPLGKATLEFGRKSLDGQLSTFSSRLESIFYGLDIQPLVDVMQRVNDLLSKDSATGKRIRAFADDVLGSLFKRVGAALTAENIEKALNGIGDATDAVGRAIESVKPIVSGLFDGALGGFDEMNAKVRPLDKLMAGFGEIAHRDNQDAWRELGRVFGWLVSLSVELVKALAWLERQLGAVSRVAVEMTQIVPGASLIRAAADAVGLAPKKRSPLSFERSRETGYETAHGLAIGINDAAGGVTFAAESLAEGTLQTTAKRLDIHSPSRAMRRLGLETARGFEQGLSDGETDRALAELTAPAAGAPPRERPTAPAIHITLGDIVVHGADAGTGEQVARDIRAQVQAELLALLEDMGLTA